MCVASCLVANSATGATLDYNESLDGDLTANFSFSSPSPVFLLDAQGTNSVSGSRFISSTASSGTSIDNDVFYVDVAADLLITSVEITFLNLQATFPK